MFGIIRTLVNFVFGIIEFLLSLRFIFKFFAVSSSTPFVAWVYSATAPLASPFVGIVPNLKLGGFVIDFATLIALIVYAFVSYILIGLFSHVGSRYYRD